MKKTARALRRRATCITLTAAMCITAVAGTLAAFADGGKGVSVADNVQSVNFTNANGTVNLDSVKLANLNSKVQTAESVDMNQIRKVIVSLDGDCLAKKTDDLSSFSATAEGAVALQEIRGEQQSFLNALDQADIRYSVCGAYNTVINAVAIETSLSNLTKIKKINGVNTVSVSSTYALPKDAEGSSGSGSIDLESIYKNGIYNSEKYVNKGVDGRGMAVAILDTGIDYTHNAFLQSVIEPRYEMDSGEDDSNIKSLMENKSFHAAELSGATYSDVYVNSKVPFAYDYADHDADVYPTYSQHGTHVAGIVGGKSTENYKNKDGYDSGELFRGVAPEAQLVICKVFTDNLDDKDLGGAETVDILNALEDCAALGVDVINMSLGTSSGFSSKSLGLTDDDEEGKWLNEVYSNIRSLGISLMAAASNEFSSGYGSAYGTNLATNPDSGTVGSPSTFSGAVSVASINGQSAHYLLANGTDKIYYEESRNEDSDDYNFINQMLGDPAKDASYVDEKTFKYVVVPGTGEATDYSNSTRNALKNKQQGEKVIAVVQRGGSKFKDKIETAKTNGADAVIVYNNVSGMIKMSLGDMQDPLPSVFVSQDAGNVLKKAGSTGRLTIERNSVAGPFMNDYSSWGTTPDLQLKPDVTSHGGEITSTVAGGYAEMSGTSMACPNLAGFTALLRGELAKTDLYTAGDSVALNKLTNNILMSTAKVVYDRNELPYSPRKQGSGLATLDNVFTTQAYLYTKDTADRSDPDFMCEDGRPKAELGEDEQKAGVYDVTFYVKNFSKDKDLAFKASTLFFTETLGADGRSVAEKAHLFTSSTASWTVGGRAVAEGGEFTVAKGEVKEIKVRLTLSRSDKKYIDDNFVNGMFVEGFLRLLSATEGQCDLSFPFMGFYGDWQKAPMLDVDCFKQAEYDKDTSLTDKTRPQPNVWATQAYSYYYNEKYATPLGSYLYLQDEDKEHTSEYVYTEMEHIAISRYNDYTGDDATDNYMTITGIKALYAGLLRNAEVVTYTLTNVDTGEVIPDDNGNAVREVYRVCKAMAAGGSAIPAQVLLELRAEDLGLPANGKYALDFNFYFSYEDYVNGIPTDDTFYMTFYVDYEAPVLVDTRLRYQDMQDSSGKEIQKVYLDLDVFDNTYPQCVVLCYSTTGETDEASLKLATEYITPILNPLKNTTTTVSIDITEIYEDYKGKLFVELDDYALNHNVYIIELDHSQTSVVTTDFTVEGGNAVTIDKNTAKKLTVENLGNANVSNIVWRSSNEEIVKVKNGEVFGVAAGKAYVTALGGNGRTQRIEVTVNDSDIVLARPTLTFGTIFNSEDAPQRAQGTVRVNPAQKIKLNVVADPWYYPIESLEGFNWTSSDESIATVDDDGNVVIIYEGDRIKSVKITATSKKYSNYSAFVTLSVKTPYTIENGVLTKYRGWGGTIEREASVTLGENGVDVNGDGKIESYTLNNVRVLRIPTDKSITSIGEEAFKDNENIEVVIIPKKVENIREKAFKNCVNLKAVCFISNETRTPADASLTLIYRNAFAGCTSLEALDFTNCKVFSLDRNAFAGCTALKRVLNMPIIGTMYDSAFAGCTSLESADLSALHVAGANVFAGCTALEEIITSPDTVLGVNMFSGCTALSSVKKLEGATAVEGLGCNNIPVGCFARCSSLEEISLAEGTRIGAGAFASSGIKNINLENATAIGDEAFRSCTKLSAASVSGAATLGKDPFMFVNSATEVKDGNKLILAAKLVTEFPAGITEIGDYAFSGSVLSGISALDLTGVTAIGKGAFNGLYSLKSVTLPDGITEIPDYAFSGTGIQSITIPDSVVSIGKGAFANCSDLSEINWGTGINSIGDQAFEGVAVTSLTLPESVKTVGNMAFANCSALTQATVTAVTSMGVQAFAMCYNLESVTFGDAATDTGKFTFVTPDAVTGYGAGKLSSVTLGDGITEIGDGAFAYCGALVSINLNNVTRVGDSAFYECSQLKNVTGLEDLVGYVRRETVINSLHLAVEKDVYYPAIGEFAFGYCTSLEEVNLQSADYIGYGAFMFCTKLSSVTFGTGLKGIESTAFAETALTTVNIPASCEKIGASAFSGTRELLAIEVEEGNANYLSEGGVLYRRIGEGSLELCAYPAGKAAPREDGVATYRVLDGTEENSKGATVTIQEFAFYGVPSNKINKIVLPHTLKTIGNGAFLNCGASAYVFNSIQAPVLLQGMSDRIIENDFSINSLLNNNFGYIAYLVPHRPGDTPESVSVLSISYPTNGRGYDNLIYKNYFGPPVLLGEMMEDSTREFVDIAEGLMRSSQIGEWAHGKDKSQVEEFAAVVRRAHILYNSLSATQLKLVMDSNGEDVNNLFAVEESLKPIKKQVGINVSVSSISLAKDSAHKTEYKVGERFDMSGIRLILTYNDLSQETIDASTMFTIHERFDRGLELTDDAVTLKGFGECAGKQTSILIKVREESEAPEPPEEGNGTQTPEEGNDTQTPAEGNGGQAPAENSGNDSQAGLIVGLIVSGLVVIGAAAAAILVLKKRKAAKPEDKDGETSVAQPEEKVEKEESSEEVSEEPTEEVAEEEVAEAVEETQELSGTAEEPTEEVSKETVEEAAEENISQTAEDSGEEGNNDD